MAWSRKGEPANVSVPDQRGISLTILGAISVYGIVGAFTKGNAVEERKDAYGISNDFHEIVGHQGLMLPAVHR